MAQHVEPMDVDSEFDNKENSYHHGNVPCTEKGYEELDVSELNRKLRYSVTPHASPMSKSYTAHGDDRISNPDDLLNHTNENDNLTRSLNSSITYDSVIKSLKSLPLQTISTDQALDNRSSVLRQLDSTVTGLDNNVTVTISGPTDIDENLSLPSSSSSAAHTPEATTPTNITRNEEGMVRRGLKSVLNIFRLSQSPTPPAEGDDTPKQQIPQLETYCENQKTPTLASTPISAHGNIDSSSSKRSSPLKDSIIFNDDLEKEIQWKEDTVLFSNEKIPIHKLLLPNIKPSTMGSATPQTERKLKTKLNTTVEYMDVSFNNSMALDNTKTETPHGIDSDGEFVDCETTFTKTETQNDEANAVVSETIKEFAIELEPKVNDTKSSENIQSEALEQLEGLDTENNNTANQNTETQEIKPTSEANFKLNVMKDVDNTTFSQTVTEHEVKDKQDTNVNEPENTTISNTHNNVAYSADTLNINNTTLENVTEKHLFTQYTENTLSQTVTEHEVKDKQDTNVNEPENTTISNTHNNVAYSADTLNINNTTLENVTEKHLFTQYTENTLSQAVTEHEVKDKQDNSVSEPENITISNTHNNVEYSADTLNINNTTLENATEKHLFIADCVIPDALVALADSTDVNVATTSNLIKTHTGDSLSQEIIENVQNNSMYEFGNYLTDIDIGIRNILNEDLSQIPEDTEGDITSTVTDDIDKMILILQQIDHEKTIDMNNFGGSTDSHINKTEEETETMKYQESTRESILPNQNKSHNEEPANIPLPDDDVSIRSKTENINIDQHELNQNIENMDTLNETNDIVNSLTEIIGEYNTEGMLNQSHIVKPMEGSECPKEKETLPDLISETIESTDLINEMMETVPASTQTPLIAKTYCVEEVCTDVPIGEKQIPELKPLHKSEAKEEDGLTIVKHINETPIDEEIILSGNNSPFVSVTSESEIEKAEENLEETDIPIVTNEVPTSPPIKSKGYNFNFDEMDDPFATKKKIRMSPTPITTYEVNECNTVHKKEINVVKTVHNRRRSQPPERKRQTMNRKKVNTTLYACRNDQYSEGDSKDLIQDTMEIKVTENKEVSKVLDFTQVLDKMIQENLNASPEVQVEENQPRADITVEVISESKSEPESVKKSKYTENISSEYSTNYPESSSSDISVPKNVFNLPEIEDKNFNPFATKSKMRQSPPIDFTTQSKLISSPNPTMVVLPKENTTFPAQNVKEQGHEDKTDLELMEKDASYDIGNTSSLSVDNKNVITREVNTEDEDTEEGPFLEAYDAVDNKVLKIDDDNMMQFNEIPTRASDENADGGELFIDAEAFEFLLNQNQCNIVADSGKESLFLKFDPLFAKRMSRGGEIFAALSQVQKRQSTPTKPTRPSLRNEASPIAGPSNVNTTYDFEANVTQDSIEDLNVTVAKPMMVVTPAINAAVTPRNKTTTPPRSNRRSINFTSPAMAVIDRLLSLSGNNSLMGHDTTVTTQINREHTEADLALTQLRELLAEKEISVYQLRSESKELKDRLSTMETQVKILEADGQDRLNKINELNDRLVEKTKINKSMAAVVEEYERTIASLIAETEQDKKRHAEERMRLISERDEQTAHLASMEVSFSDLHSKYEKSKQLILSCKANEEICKKSIRDFEENLAKMQLNYEALKQHATSKLNHANKEFQMIAKAHESEVLKHKALIKRKDMHITSLEETLAQKTKANEELTAICDELINKVG